jgi:hemerythrin-like domain-containing protein
MSVYESIRQHHLELRHLFDRCLGLVDDTAARRAAFEALRDGLRAHAHAEEIVLYGKLRGDLFNRAVDARREHALESELLARLDRLPPDNPDFQVELVGLRRAFDRHVEWEESFLLPHAEEQLGHDVDDVLGDEWRRIEQR